ncbi:MAG: hypothetical protein SGPRY_003600 [Prymnesium sp.]
MRTLPPGLFAELRGICSLSLSQLTWNDQCFVESACMRIKWWGEANDGCILRPTDAAEPALDATATYHINCSREQLAKYLNDMRVLVIDLISEAPEGPALAHVHGHAYLHLAMLSFDQLCSLELSVYDEYSLEIARPAKAAAHVQKKTQLLCEHPGKAAAGLSRRTPRAPRAAEGGAREALPQLGSEIRCGLTACQIRRNRIERDEASGESIFLSKHLHGRLHVLVLLSAADRNPDLSVQWSCGSIAIVSALSSSFILNEKRALFDSSLPLLPQQDTPVVAASADSLAVTPSAQRRERNASREDGISPWVSPRSSAVGRAMPDQHWARIYCEQSPPPRATNATRTPEHPRSKGRAPRPQRVGKASPADPFASLELLEEMDSILQRATRLRAAVVSSSHASTVQARRAAEAMMHAATRDETGGHFDAFDSTIMPTTAELLPRSSHHRDRQRQHPEEDALLKDVFYSQAAAPDLHTASSAGSSPRARDAPHFEFGGRDRASPSDRPSKSSSAPISTHDLVESPRDQSIAAPVAQAPSPSPDSKAVSVSSPPVAKSGGEKASLDMALQLEAGAVASSGDENASSTPSNDPVPATSVESRLHVDLEIESARIADESGRPQHLNTYIVCRLCPLLLGEAELSSTIRGACEKGQIRTEVCWGSSTPQYRFKHTAPLLTEGIPRMGRGVRGSKEGNEQDLVLEIWSLTDDTQAEDLVGLVRCRVHLSSGMADQVYATTLLDCVRPVINPFDVTTRGELTLRLRVGTPRQLFRSLHLKLAVATIQMHWRRVRNHRLHLVQQQIFRAHSVRGPSLCARPRSTQSAARESRGDLSETDVHTWQKTDSEEVRSDARSGGDAIASRRGQRESSQSSKSLTPWTFVIRVVRAAGVDHFGIMGNQANQDHHEGNELAGQVYVHYRVFGQGSVTTSVFGETEAKAEAAHLELWWAPSLQDLPNAFRHSLLGTATASLLGAEDGVQLSCGVHACGSAGGFAAEVCVAFSLAKGPCENNHVPLDLPRPFSSSEAVSAVTAASVPAAELPRIDSGEIMEDERYASPTAHRADDDASPILSNPPEPIALSDWAADLQSELPLMPPLSVRLTVGELLLPLSERGPARGGQKYAVRLLLPNGAVYDSQWIAPTNGGTSSQPLSERACVDRLAVSLAASFTLDASHRAAEEQAELQVHRVTECHNPTSSSEHHMAAPDSCHIDGNGKLGADTLVGYSFASLTRNPSEQQAATTSDLPTWHSGVGLEHTSEERTQVCTLLRVDGCTPTADGALRVHLEWRSLPSFPEAVNETGRINDLRADPPSCKEEMVDQAEPEAMLPTYLSGADGTLGELSGCMRDLEAVTASLQARLRGDGEGQIGSQSVEKQVQPSDPVDSGRLDEMALACSSYCDAPTGGLYESNSVQAHSLASSCDFSASVSSEEPSEVSKSTEVDDPVQLQKGTPMPLIDSVIAAHKSNCD